MARKDVVKLYTFFILITFLIVVGGFLFWACRQGIGMIELISSALTPIIAVTVAYIAYKQCEAPNRSRAAGHLMTTVFILVALTLPCPSRSRAAGYND